jgi:hypothetical protein
MASHEE